MFIGLVAAYERNVGVNLEKEAKLLASAERSAKIFKWLASLALLGLMITTAVTVFTYKQSMPIRCYVTVESFFSLGTLLGVTFFRKANKECVKHWKIFQDFNEAWEKIDPIECTWRTTRRRRKTTTTSVLSNLEEMRRQIDAYEALIKLLVNRQGKVSADVIYATDDLKAAEETLKAARASLHLFSIVETVET